MSNEILNAKSGKAKALLLEAYPPGYGDHFDAFRLISSRNWKATDAKMLARAYLPLGPFSHTEPYEMFYKLMEEEEFLEIVNELLPVTSAERRDLLDYHVKVVLRKAEDG